MEFLTKEFFDICLNVVKQQKISLMIMKNFGVISVWIVDYFDPKGVGKNYNYFEGREVTSYLKNHDFYAPAGKTILEQAQGINKTHLKFGHDEYIYILNAD